MKIAITTNFHEMNPGYSLSGIVSDQITMLSKYGHDVHLFVSEKFQDTYPTPSQATLHKTVKSTPLIDYVSGKDLTPEHMTFIREYAKQLTVELQSFDVVFTHDFIFTGWNLPFAATVMEVTRQIPKLNWLHWIHSIPSGRRDWWKLCEAYGIGNHKIVFPNGTDAQRVALQFRCHVTDVTVIPHIKDLRTWFDFHPDAARFIDTYPLYMQADFVQIYPAGSDRLTAKRADIPIKIFGCLKQKGHSVCLVIANPWAVKAKLGRCGDVSTHDFTRFYETAEKWGLENGKDFIFTSDFDIEKYGLGIPKNILQQLMLCANVFIYPTREESFGLVGPESALSGAKIMVLNKDLAMMKEVNAGIGIFESFGSYTNVLPEPPKSKWMKIADKIIKSADTDLSVKSATSFRQRLNYDYIYKYHYLPVLERIKNDTVS